MPPDLPRPPRLRRRRGLAAGRTSPSSGAATWAGSASLGPTSSWRSVSTDALFAERVGAERPPRDRRLRCPPADRVRAPAPSAEPSAGASRTGGDSRSRSSLPTAAAPGTASSSEEAPRGPVDLVWEEGLRPDRRLRRRRGWEAPVEDSSASGEGPVGPSSRSSSGAVASFICSLNRTSFRASGPRAGASSSCSEGLGERDPGIRCQAKKGTSTRLATVLSASYDPHQRARGHLSLASQLARGAPDPVPCGIGGLPA